MRTLVDNRPAAMVEVVVPTYNRPERLIKAVSSALTETPFPVTVLDDHSPVPAAETLDVAALNTVHGERLRVIRNAANLGASLNILRALEVSRARYTWAFADDQVVSHGAGAEILDTINQHPEAAILFWHCGLSEGERVDIGSLEDYVRLIERGRSAYSFSDVFFNRVVRTDVGLRYQRLDARFSHAEPMVGIQLAALANGHRMHIRGGGISDAQGNTTSSWSASYVQRFKLDPAYLIPDASLRCRYRAVVARHVPWRALLIDAPIEGRGSIDEAFLVDAAWLIFHSPISWRLRIEARLALLLRNTTIGRLLTRAIPPKRGVTHSTQFEKMRW